MDRIQTVKDAHPNLNEEDIRLLLVVGYQMEQEMEEWTDLICSVPLANLIHTLSFLKSECNGPQRELK